LSNYLLGVFSSVTLFPSGKSQISVKKSSIVFTGLVQARGTLKPFGENQLQIESESHSILQDLALGDSVAVDGVCLTVEKILPASFVVAVSPETLRRTTLGRQLLAQGRVNLETSLRVGSKLGGHFVTGHVDGTGCLQESVSTATSWEMSFTATAAEVSRYIVSKGSIAINGVSLTVAECNSTGTWFKIAVIPHTFAETNLRDLGLGSWVNLEGDILGKYVEKFLRSGQLPSTGEITPSFLAEHGYL